jgi:hypothetical protein
MLMLLYSGQSMPQVQMRVKMSGYGRSGKGGQDCSPFAHDESSSWRPWRLHGFTRARDMIEVDEMGYQETQTAPGLSGAPS